MEIRRYETGLAASNKRKREEEKGKNTIGSSSYSNKAAKQSELKESVPSHLIGKKLPRCGICTEKKKEAAMFKSICSHSFCQSCIGRHISAKVHDGKIRIPCPDPACTVMLKPESCRSFVSQRVFDRWEIMICESAIGSERIYCPFSDCSVAMVFKDEHKRMTSAECPHCHRLFCVRCRVPWHSGSQCRTEAEIMDKKFMEIAQREKWQRCPSCRFYVQRSSGCESITCRCGFKFCYMCGKNWVYGHVCR